MSKLKDIRLKNKISQEQLAVDVGVTVRYIAFLESGKRKPSIDVAFKIAKALQTTVDNIFCLLSVRIVHLENRKELKDGTDRKRLGVTTGIETFFAT